MSTKLSEIDIWFWNITARFVWEAETISQIASKDIFPWMPAYRLIKDTNTTPALSLQIKYWSKFVLQFSWDKTEGNLIVPQNEFTPEAPIIAVQTVLEYFRNKIGSMTLHASALSIDKTWEWVIFFGRQWSGKTTMLLDLCRRWVAKLIGNDYVIVEWLTSDSTPLIRYWTTDIHLRLASIQDHFPELVPLFPQNNMVAPFRHKQFVHPEELWITIRTSTTGALINQSYFINVLHDMRELYPEVLHKWCAEWQYVLPENASRLIRGTGQRILWKSGYPILAPIDFDTPEVYFAREKMIDSIMGHTMSLTGNRKDVWDYILSRSQ